MNPDQMVETIKTLNAKIEDLQIDLEILQRTNAIMRSRVKELHEIVGKQCVRVTELRFPEMIVTAQDLTRGPFIVENLRTAPTAVPLPRR